MRLIDADDFKVFLQNLVDAGAEYNGIIELLDKQATAYDVDRVVEQLEGSTEYWNEKAAECDEIGDSTNMDICDGKYDEIMVAIEIVKKGSCESE